MQGLKIFSPGRTLSYILAEHIELGLYAPGERLPTVPELAALHGVTLRRARSALEFLAADGVVINRWKDGYYVPIEPGTGQDEQAQLWSTAMAAVLNSPLTVRQIAQQMNSQPKLIHSRLKREVPLTPEFTDSIVSATVQDET